jgi:outer membrane protein OmpA-like peptidoglycan-associated protein
MDNAEIASGTSRADSQYHYNLMPGKSFVLKADKDGYFAGTSTTINVVKKEENDTMRVNVYLKKIPHAAIRVANIYYDFNMATLRPESITGLDSLYQIMVDNPSLIVEIGSHTDSKGTHEYNVKLSQARAQSVVDFLINKGISKDRLVAKGYAETEPIAPNTINGKDNPEGRQMNRRTEFKIIGTIPNTEIIYKQGNPNFNPNENNKSTNEEPNFFKINKDNSDSTQAH